MVSLLARGPLSYHNMETAQRLATVTHSDQTATERVRVGDKQQGRDKERQSAGWMDGERRGRKETKRQV